MELKDVKFIFLNTGGDTLVYTAENSTKKPVKSGAKVEVAFNTVKAFSQNKAFELVDVVVEAGAESEAKARAEANTKARAEAKAEAEARAKEEEQQKTPKNEEKTSYNKNDRNNNRR